MLEQNSEPFKDLESHVKPSWRLLSRVPPIYVYKHEFVKGLIYIILELYEANRTETGC